MRKLFRQIGLIALLLLVSACARIIVPPAVAPQYFSYRPWSVREDELQAITHWNIRGAFSFQQDSQAHIANYTWEQIGQRYNIFIRSTLDVMGAQIKGGPNWAWLYRGDRAPVKARSPEKLMAQELGYAIPIDDLTFWIRGMPAPAKYRATFDEFGHIKTLSQDGWKITFDRYTRFHDTDVPRLLDLTRASGLKVRIVVSAWEN